MPAHCYAREVYRAGPSRLIDAGDGGGGGGGGGRSGEAAQEVFDGGRRVAVTAVQPAGTYINRPC
jgi:hypothetical protein